MTGSALRGCTGIRIRTGSRCLKNSNRFPKFFTSSSSAAKKEPKLSNRNKRDLFILALGTCGAFGYYSLHQKSDWDHDVWIVQTKLIASSAGQKRRRNENTNGTVANNIKSVLPQDGAFPNPPPPVVLRFIEKVLTQPNLLGENNSKDVVHQHPSWSIASAKQSGEFFASKQWYPFDATLMAAASTENPGFVWDAGTTILKLSNRILEYYITHIKEENDATNNEQQSCQAENGIVTKVWGKYPLIQVEEEEPYILLWLAMTPLFPNVFLQFGEEHGRNSVLKWNDNDIVFPIKTRENNRAGTNGYASAELFDGSDKYFVEFFFGEEDDLLHKTKVMSPSLPQPWQAIYTNYQEHNVVVNQKDDGKERENIELRVLIPSKIEIGKGEGDDYQAHFKINNWHLNYEM